MRRVPSTELLDSGLLAFHEVRANLDDLWIINRYLGGLSGTLRLLVRFLERSSRHRIRVLEVGAGDGRMAVGLRRALDWRGIAAEFCALDLRLEHLQATGGPLKGLHRVAADALHLPFADGSFDLAMCNLFFHHFSGAGAVQLLGALSSVSREAVLINDLERHWLPYTFVRLVPWLWRSRVTRLDGMASIRQAYTRKELCRMASLAGFRDFETLRLRPFRVGMLLWKNRLVAPR
jgi:Methyltransferase domain